MKTIFALTLVMMLSSGFIATEAAEDMTCAAGKDEYCGMCTDGACTNCYMSFMTSGDKMCTAITTALENCVMYSSQTVCTMCAEKYQLAAAGASCTAVTEEMCLVYNVTTSKCTACSNGKPGTDGKCPGTTKCDAGCTACGETMCHTCETAGQTWDFGTNACVANTMNCVLTSGKCSVCNYGFYANNLAAADLTCLASTKYSSTSVIQTISMLVISFMMF